MPDPRRQRRSPKPAAPGIVRRLRARVAALPWFARWPLRVGLVALAVLAALDLVYSWLASRYDLADLERMPERSIVFDRNGREMGRLHGENRIVIPLSQVSPHFVQALLAREDDRFHSHGGVDWIGVARALFRMAKDGARQGASTITMQLARNSFDLTRDKSLHRKLLEIALTRRIEANLTKDQILERYVNRIFFGTGIHGVERAAQLYFGKHAAQLRLDEAAMLAAIIRGPNRFSPFRHYDIAVSGRNMVLDRMVETGRVSPEAAGEAKAAVTRVLKQPGPDRESWAMDAIRRDLERVLDANDIEDGGLRIFTTIDAALQTAAEQTLARELDRIEKLPGYEHQTHAAFSRHLRSDPDATPSYLQGALVVVENATGAVLATVGGRDPDHSAFNRAILSRRQAGSTFKPFVYAAAVERGLLPGAMISDDAIQPGDIRSADDPEFRPMNADRTWQGFRRTDWGLAKSRNTMAVRVGEFAGIDAVRDLAARCGLGTPDTRSAQLYLGNTGVTLEALTSAFSAFANAGTRCRPFVIDRIEGADKRLLFRSGIMETQAIKPGAAWLTARMLQQVCRPGGTAAELADSGLPGPLGGKTGTTDDYRDAWFVGFNPRVTCGIWIGLDDPERIIHRGYGSRLAVPLWTAVMRRATAGIDRAAADFRHPPLQQVDICPAGGVAAGNRCRGKPVRELLPVDSIPSGPCPIHGASR